MYFLKVTILFPWLKVLVSYSFILVLLDLQYHVNYIRYLILFNSTYPCASTTLPVSYIHIIHLRYSVFAILGSIPFS